MSGGIVAAQIARARKRIVADFEEPSATAPERAIAYTPSDRRIARREFGRLTDFGAIVETKPGFYYLDRDRLDDYRSRLRRRAGIIAACIAVGLGAVVALGH